MITNLDGLFIIDVNGLTCFPVTIPMLLNFDGIRTAVEDTLLEKIQKEFDDDMREELREEIKNDHLKDIQNGVDDYISELDTDLDDVRSNLKGLRNLVDDIEYAYKEVQSTIDRGLDVEDSC